MLPLEMNPASSGKDKKNPGAERPGFNILKAFLLVNAHVEILNISFFVAEEICISVKFRAFGG